MKMTLREISRKSEHCVEKTIREKRRGSGTKYLRTKVVLNVRRKIKR